MRVSRILKICFITIATVTLMACGGGGSGSDPAPSKPNAQPTPAPTPSTTLDINVPTSSVQMSENGSETVTFSVNYTGSNSLTYTVSVNGVEELSVTQSGEVLMLTASDVTQIANNATVRVDVTDGSLSDSTSFNVAITNTSFFSDRDSLLGLAGGIKTFADNDVTAYNTIVFFTDIDVKTGLLSQDSLGDEIQRRGDGVSAANTQLSQDIQSLINSLNDYDSTSSGSESELDTLLQQVQEAKSAYVSDISSVYAVVRSTGGVLPEARFTSLNEDGDSYSLFVGNTTMGTATNGTWSFSEEYAFLDAVINSNVCYVL